MKARKDIIKICKKNPFLVKWSYLGSYDDLEWEYPSLRDAKRVMNNIINEARKNKKPFFAELTKRIIVKTEE